MKTPLLTGFLFVLFSCQDATENKTEKIQVIDSTGFEKEIVDTPKVNPNLISFLENPIDLIEFKATKGKSLSSVTNGLAYHYKPGISDSIFYLYTTFPNDRTWKHISPVNIIVFKFGKNKHEWKDETEILIELNVSGKDPDFKQADLVGLSREELESEFGSDYKVIEDRMVYSYKNTALILELKNSKVKKFKYIKLSTEIIDSALVKKILKNDIPIQ